MIIALVLMGWLTASVLVLGLCVMAARGDGRERPARAAAPRQRSLGVAASDRFLDLA
jgi:hypothetical protein